MTRKRMESWFARRLESLQNFVQDMKEKPEKQLEVEKLLQKIMRLKKKQPWNKNKPNLILDDALINASKPDVNTSGTATPFSHYVCFFSAAASQDNTINQAFIVSAENSINGSMIAGGSGQWDHLPKSQREMFESMFKKLNDSNISITEKEKLFCGMFKKDASESNLRHVKIEDMLDISRMSNSKDSLSLDMNNAMDAYEGKASQQFNHNIRLGEVKKSGMDQVMSPLLSSIHAKSFLESMKDNIDKSHLSFDQQILLDERKSVVPITNRKDEEPQERPSELDKAISNISVSDHQIENTDLRKTQDMKSIRDFLSSARDAKDQSKLKDFILSVENRKSKELGAKGPEMDLSMIEKKKENFESKLLERLNASDSFLGDDEIKDFLDKAEDQEFNFTNSNKVLPITKVEEEPKPCKQNNIKDLSQMNILDTFKDDPDQKINDSQIRKSSESVISQRKIINDNLSLDTSQNSGHFKRTTGTVPSLDFSKLRDRKKPQSVSTLPNNANVNITIINSSMNQSSMLEQKPFEDSEDDESENKKTEKPSEKTLPALKEEKPPTQANKTPIKFQNQRYLEEAEDDSHGKKPYYPRRSIDFLPKPPGLPKQNLARSNFSLIEEMAKNGTINNTSFEQKAPAKKGHQLHTSMFSLPGETSFDNSMIKKSNDFGKKSSDYKNNRNSRSFQLQRNAEENKPISQAAKALGILIGKSNHSHIRQMTEMSPSTKTTGDHPYNIKGNYPPSFHDKQHSLQINYTHLFNKSGPHDNSNPASYESTQVAPKGLITQQDMMEGSNSLKKVLTYEDSKMYPTPQKPPKREFSRRIHNENFNGLNITKDDESSIMGKGMKDKKPMSPMREDKSKIMNQSVNNGGGHFRMKRFNVKKL